VKFAVSIFYALLFTLQVSAQFSFLDLFRTQKSLFDYNEDGIIRCAILAPTAQDQREDFNLICQDLEQMILNSKPDMPVRVTFEEITQTQTVMGWWYHPDTVESRQRFTATAYDYVIVAESKSIISDYPEIFFEGVRITQNKFAAKRASVLLLAFDPSPASKVNDARVDKLIELNYRVADGCGIKVVPSLLAWRNVVQHHILQSNSLLNKRANCYLTAASIWCQISGQSVPKASFITDWVVKKTAYVMALAAEEAVNKALLERHYSRPFQGVVRMDDRERPRYLFYHAGSRANEALRSALDFLAVSDGKQTVQYSTADWYDTGLDRHAYPFDLTCGSIQEMEPLLDNKNYTSTEFISPELPASVRVIYNRNPSNDDNNELTLRNLEKLLIEGFTFARKNDFVFIPYQIAWARLWSVNPDYVKPVADKISNDWLNYMLAGMIYTALTGNYIEPPEVNMPLYYGELQPGGIHRLASRTGWHCMRQLAALKICDNAIISAASGSFIDRSNPAFIRIRLLEPPAAPVKILCAPTDPANIMLSRSEFVFDASNFDIEQVLRCASAGQDTNVFSDVLISAVSNDDDIDGVARKHTFLLNRSNGQRSSLSFATNQLDLSAQSYVMLGADTRPLDMVYVSVLQNGVETTTLCFSPDYYQQHPVCLFPSAAAIAAGSCEVTLNVVSQDRRFDGLQRKFEFKLNYGDVNVPQLRIVAPLDESVIEGPAFVNAEAMVAECDQQFELSLFCGRKLLGSTNESRLKAAVEMGAPLTRLSKGEYPLWAALRLANGMVIASPVARFVVEEVKPHE